MKGLTQKFYSTLMMGLLGVSGILYVLFVLEVTDEYLLLNWCYFLFALAILAAVLFAVVGMVKDFRKARYSIIGMATLLIIFAIGYTMADSEVYKVGEIIVDEDTSRRSEAGLITFYILMVISVLSIVYVEINKAFK